MLYVFHVETGTMMKFDMNLAMEKVASLQSVITKGCRIPEDKQVLLISGGESLDHNNVVGKYHAGTDTNPIFLFSKSTIESSIPPSPSVNYGSDIDLQDQVEGSLLMPPAYETVVSRAQLALQFEDVDTEELRACEHLILDQHLQQQGWAAVVANLEDVTSELKQRSETFHDTYQQYLENRQGYKELISSVSESLLLLSKIPVLPSLVTSSDAMKGDCSSSDEMNSSLYDWIESQDPNHTLHDMVEQCGKSTEQLDQKVDEALCSEVDQLMKEVQNDSMKEVKGLEDRLYGLDQIISGAKKVVQEQAELAQGFVQNQNRLSNLRDRSILPDLCSSHRNQLIEMMKNHSRLREIKKKCRMAKEELSVNLHTRLRWVMYVEKKICDVDGKLTIYLGNLRRLRKRVDILQQVQDAPKVYAQLVIEVVRRKQFSGKYLSWATSLAEDSGQLHEDEVKRRDSFLRLIGHHFLQPMFQGLEDYPPSFATEAPDLFDNNLPEVTPDDIKQLRDAVPELAHVLSDPAKDEFVIAPRCVPPDSSVKWEDSAELGLKVPRIPRRVSGCRSDSEALHDDQSPYSIEGGSISLGDQFEECKVEVHPLVHKPGFDSTSPPDTEFLLPKSLSEELTLEMKDSEGGLKSPLSVAVEGAKTKETISVTSIVSPACKPGSSSRKSITDTSPDLETSQEFTTADFYFDESMPSSIESPPKTCSDKSNLEQCFLAEKQQNVKLQQQVKEYARKLGQNEKTLKLLKQFLDTKLPSLTDSAKELKKEHEEHVQTVIKEFENIRDNVIQQVQSFESDLAEKSQTEIEKVNTEKKEMEKLLDETSKKSLELEKSVSELNEDIKEKDKRHKVEFDEYKDKLETEMKELNQKHELELEVELDKIRAEYDEKINSFEKEIEAKNDVIKVKESAIKKLETNIIKIEENLIDKFQTEKEQICDILGMEYKQKLEKEVDKKVEKMKQSVVADLTEKHEKEKTQQLDELKQCLIAEKQEAVVMTQSTLTDEHTRGLEDVKKKFMDEKLAKIEEIRREMDSKVQEDIAKLSSEFNKEKESLVEELNVFKNKQTAVIEIQTVHSMFGTSDVESQSDPTPVQTDTQAQTDVFIQKTSSMQTDSNDQSHLAVQTESVSTKSSTNQTDKTQTVESSVQPDLINGVEVSIQTDKCDNDCDNANCESSVIESVKTETDEIETSDDKTDHVDVEEVRRALQAEHQEKTASLEKEHSEVIDRLIAQIEKEKEDAQQLKSSLTSLTGNQQTKFNEAVNRVSREKDSKIEDLKVRELKLYDEIKKLKDQVDQLTKEKSKAEDVKERALSFLKDKEAILHQMETELEDARHQSRMDQVNVSPDADVVVEETTQAVADIVSAEEPSLQQKIKNLESMVKSKEEEISKLTQKVMELSMSSSTRSLVQDKVSITSCHIGDLVLLCLDERLDQYVVFTVGTTLHFLHTECLLPLGLKAEAGEGKKQWLIAEVVDKEYCQAKKSNNRFKVPVGTKFYRVKAKRWTREVNPSPGKKSDTASGSS